MFQRLIASRAQPAPRKPTAAALAVLLGHGALISAALRGTTGLADPPNVIPTVVMPWRQSPQRAAQGDVRDRIPNAPMADPVSVPVEIPLGLPPIEGATPFDPAQCVDCAGLAVGDPRVDGDGSWPSDVVEEPPVVLAGRPPSYPEMLRATGITGRVVVQAVIDTLGRAEPGMTVVESSRAGFEAPALDYVRRALFRPGRVHGRPVRVLIRLPVDFRLTDGR